MEKPESETPHFTDAEFAAMSAFQKGYAVYMYGAREDVPNVPESYEPTADEREEYTRGQFRATIDAQDSEEG